MAKLTITDVAYRIHKSIYTVKRWYNWYEQLSQEELTDLKNNKGMPELPKYEVVGSTKWRYWDEADIPQIQKFSDWMPTTRNGVIGNYKK